jgi:membrane-bound metal-dependent hydrolase YbcI (DUF457 family)
MDTITHGIVGSLIGKGYFSEREGKVAIFAATLGAIFPDSDVVMEIISRDPLAIIKYHRGITHSFVAMPFFALAFAWLTRALFPPLQKKFSALRELRLPSFGMLTLIYMIGIASHILLDGLTSFGTRMWTPISNARVAWDWLFIIDYVFTALVLLPQVAAWVHANRERHTIRAFSMWVLFTLGAGGSWGLANLVGLPFHKGIVVLASAIFAALFFLPARGDWGFRLPQASWSRAGLWLSVAYVLACGYMHHTALKRVQNFAAENHIDLERIGALPLPPSLLDWGGVIRSNDGVYQSRFDLRQAPAPPFVFHADSPPDSYTARAMDLPDVKIYWGFARFPLVRTSTEDDRHVVDFLENRFITRRTSGPPPFSYRVVFDDSGDVIEEGWQQDPDFLRRIERFPRRKTHAAPGDSP